MDSSTRICSYLSQFFIHHYLVIFWIIFVPELWHWQILIAIHFWEINFSKAFPGRFQVFWTDYRLCKIYIQCLDNNFLCFQFKFTTMLLLVDWFGPPISSLIDAAHVAFLPACPCAPSASKREITKTMTTICFSAKLEELVIVVTRLSWKRLGNFSNHVWEIWKFLKFWVMIHAEGFFFGILYLQDFYILHKVMVYVKMFVKLSRISLLWPKLNLQTTLYSIAFQIL